MTQVLDMALSEQLERQRRQRQRVRGMLVFMGLLATIMFGLTLLQG
ncbi:hypothetical protein K2X14_13165 [Acetobacter sp. TBRC 12305]|uniref:Uncharacterized protein n=1 Tax=Acetobacter garciniae TaxID=2817435 RepID=A0A939HQX5_9PROT|nr:hypothetical protein [Acetobacter garciniae]MBO1325891.1 hypothetical protein [Acetobacter garciniae]MBX0345791.1 hypothetical protein [Acetobacter garciniae]